MQTSNNLTLRQFVEMHVAVTQRIFELQKYVDPMFIGEQADGNWATIPALFKNDVEKDITAAAVREIFKEQNVNRYVFITEAWTLVLPADIDVNNVVRPSLHPDRVEMLMIEAEDKQNSITVSMTINRDGKKVILGEPKYNETNVSIGRFVGLLKTEH